MSTLAPDHPLIRRLVRQKLLPVLTITDPETVAPLADLLHEAGLAVIEVTLRTPAAANVIEAFAGDERFLVGAGTVRCREDLKTAAAAGARFAVSPGATDRLLEAAATDRNLAFIPGVASAGEMMRAAEYGFNIQKFFPAGALGGPKVLKAIAGPLPDLRLVPTGGITPESAPEWLALANVLAVGGSWMAPANLINARNFTEIGRRLAALPQSPSSPSP